MPTLPSLTTIARLAQVAPSTVSLALRGSPRVRALTGDRVRAIAAELGYVPRPELAALGSARFRAGDRRLVRIVFVADDTQAARAAVLERYAAARGFNLCRRAPPALDEATAWRRKLGAEGVRAVILDERSLPAALITQEWAPLIAVQLGASSGVETCHPTVIHADPFRAAWACFQHVHAAGYRRIGFSLLSHDPLCLDDHARHAAWLAAGECFGAAFTSVPLRRCRFGAPSGGRAALAEWVRRHDPDAIIGFAPTLWYLLRDLRLMRPYAALHVPRSDPWAQPVAGMMLNEEAFVGAAFDLLDEQLRHGVLPAQIRAVGMSWRDGASLPVVTG